MNSLQQRLKWGLTLSLMLLMALLWWAGSLAVRELGEDLIGSRLEHDAESLLTALTFSNEDQPQISWKRTNPIYNQPFSGHYYVIHLDNKSSHNSRSLWDQTLKVPHLKTGEAQQWYANGPSEQKLLVWAKYFEKQNHGFTLAIAEDLTPLESHLSLFQWTFAALSLAVLFILLLVQKQVINKSFQRLDAVRADIQHLEQGEIGSLSEDVPDEVLPLVQEFNRLLELLTQRLERSRNSLGNLAHALKGPLNLLVQSLDSPALSNHPDLRLQAQTQTQRIHQLMERELKRARLAGSGSPGQRFIAQQELPDLIRVLKQVHAKQALDIELQIATDTPPFGDREDMLELIGNLLDNACKWAESKVLCRISGNSRIHISVDDDGPGRSEQELEQLAQRGIKLDETVEGHGLGLSIAKDIIKLYNGQMQFKHSQGLCGLHVGITLEI